MHLYHIIANPLFFCPAYKEISHSADYRCEAGIRFLHHKKHCHPGRRIIGKVTAEPSVPAIFSHMIQGYGLSRILHYPHQIPITKAGHIGKVMDKCRPLYLVELSCRHKAYRGRLKNPSAVQLPFIQQHLGKPCIIINRGNQSGPA